jgi:hypothetical protein
MKIKKIFWILNFILFALTVTVGINQAGIGAEASSFEKNTIMASELKRELTNEVYKLTKDDRFIKEGGDLGFISPSSVYYFNQEDVALSLR